MHQSVDPFYFPKPAGIPIHIFLFTIPHKSPIEIVKWRRWKKSQTVSECAATHPGELPGGRSSAHHHASQSVATLTRDTALGLFFRASTT